MSLTASSPARSMMRDSAAPQAMSATKGQTMNNRSVRVEKGTLVARPFPTSSKPFVKSYPASVAFGKHDLILNPPNKERQSTYKTHFNSTARMAQTAGSSSKLPVPYKPNAARNRVLNEPKRLPPPFSSTVKLDEAGVLNSNIHPYRTVSKTVQLPTVKPLEARVGFTNMGITSQFAQRAHKMVFAA